MWPEFVAELTPALVPKLGKVCHLDRFIKSKVSIRNKMKNNNKFEQGEIQGRINIYDKRMSIWGSTTKIRNKSTGLI